MGFTVALIGRPNVGKSTLFNRLTGTRHALVHDTPGVTRDVREGEGSLGPLTFTVLDTAGLEEAEKGSLAARMTAFTMDALKRADVALMLADARAGVTAMDRHFAQLARKSGKPVVLALNKAEGRAGENALLEAHQLGFGDAIPISAEHGDGMADLYEALAPYADRESRIADSEDELRTANDDPLKIAIIGRPNAGKSTLVNTLLKEERVLTGPEAGITRDSIAVPFTYRGRELKLVDTAGMRRRANVQEKLEKLSVGDTLRSIQYAEIVVLVMDATNALEKQDLQIASLVEQEGRALVLAVNKWDLVSAKDQKMYLEAVDDRMEKTLAQIAGVPVVPISAESGKGLDKLMSAVFAIEKAWNLRVPTAQINRWLEDALATHAPPLMKGRRLKVRYMTQTKTRPPTFTLFANLSDIPDHYSRYLLTGLRETFGLHGVPLRFKVKKNKNPYEKDER
jgi:GTP-binding protein